MLFTLKIRGNNILIDTCSYSCSLCTDKEFRLIKEKLNTEEIEVYNEDGNIIVLPEYKENYIIARVGNELDTVYGAHLEDDHSKNEIKEFIRHHKVINMIDENDVESKVKIVEASREFKDEVSRKYNEYIAKSELIGKDNRFEYVVDGEDVILTDYRGNEDEFVIPNFVTYLGNNSLTSLTNNHKLQEVILSKNLKCIGAGVFRTCNLQKIVIPKSVQLIMREALNDNEQLVDRRQTLISEDNFIEVAYKDYINKDNLILINDNTITLGLCKDEE